MRVAFTGGRDYAVSLADVLTLNDLRASLPITEVLVGDAGGADAFIRDWADSHSISCRVFKADWKRYGRKAGPIRNRMMLLKAEGLIALPGGRGTANCCRQARELGIKRMMLR